MNKLDLKSGKWIPSGEYKINIPLDLETNRTTGVRIGDREKYIYLGNARESGHYVYSLKTGRVNKIKDSKYKKLRSEKRSVSLSRPNKSEKKDIHKLMEYINWFGKTIDSNETMEDHLKSLIWFLYNDYIKEQLHYADGYIYGVVNNEDNFLKLRKRFGEDLNIKAIGEDLFLFNTTKRSTDNEIGLSLLDIGFHENFRGENII